MNPSLTFLEQNRGKLRFLRDYAAYLRTCPYQEYRSGGIKLRYRLHRGGPVCIVLLIGGTGVCDMFFQQFRRLAALDYTVLLPDYPVGVRTNAEMTRVFQDFLRSFSFSRTVLAGQSYGGFLAQFLAAAMPREIDALVLSNTGTTYAGLPPECLHLTEGLARKLTLSRKLLTSLPLPDGLLQGLEYSGARFSSVRTLPREERAYLTSFFHRMSREITVTREESMLSLMLDLFQGLRLETTDLAYLENRGLLLLSDDDKLFPPAMKQGLSDLLPGALLKTDLYGGHLAFALHAEEYTRTVDAFLRERM